MAKKEPERAAPAEPEEYPLHSYIVLTDRLTVGEKGKRVSLPANEQTAALVEAGHIKPASKAAATAVEEAGE
jgi:hypothetical protein